MFSSDIIQHTVVWDCGKNYECRVEFYCSQICLPHILNNEMVCRRDTISLQTIHNIRGEYWLSTYLFNYIISPKIFLSSFGSFILHSLTRQIVPFRLKTYRQVIFLSVFIHIMCVVISYIVIESSLFSYVIMYLSIL